MKNLFLILVVISAITISCSSTNSGSYFGYKNKPEYTDTKPSSNNQQIPNTVNSNAGWVNPMNSNNTNSVNGFVYSDYSYRYNPYMYVPVMVPWWSQYQGWVSYPFPGSHLSVCYSNFWGYEWYSPYYTYHPWSGNYWGVWHNGYHNWYNQPVYSRNERPVQKNTYRSFGANRGTYSNTSSSRNVGSSSSRGNSNLGGTTSGRVETSSSRIRNESSTNSGNIFRGSESIPTSDRTSSTRSSSSNRGENKTFRPVESSRPTADRPASNNNGNVYRSNNDNSGSTSGRTYSAPSSNNGSSSSSRGSESNSGSSSGSSNRGSSGSSSSGSSSERGSSSGTSSGRTR